MKGEEVLLLVELDGMERTLCEGGVLTASDQRRAVQIGEELAKILIRERVGRRRAEVRDQESAVSQATPGAAGDFENQTQPETHT